MILRLAATADVLVSMNEWNIQSRAHECATCGHQFAHKQTYHTLLFEERSGFRRIDVCDPCWVRENSNDVQRVKSISCWHGVYEAPAAKPPDPIQKETAETLLRKLIELNDPRYMPAGYILAVMLERKRLLKVKEQVVREGHRLFVYEQPRTGDVFMIQDPELKLDQLAQIQHDVSRLLEHGFEAVILEQPGSISAEAGPSLAPAPSAPSGMENQDAPAGPAPVETESAPPVAESAAEPAPAPVQAEQAN